MFLFCTSQWSSQSSDEDRGIHVKEARCVLSLPLRISDIAQLQASFNAKILVEFSLRDENCSNWLVKMFLKAVSKVVEIGV